MSVAGCILFSLSVLIFMLYTFQQWDAESPFVYAEKHEPPNDEANLRSRVLQPEGGFTPPWLLDETMALPRLFPKKKRKKRSVKS